MKQEKLKSNSTVTARWGEGAEADRLTLTVHGAGEVVFDMARAGHLIDRAAMHGFEQRLRDRAAMSRDTKTGESASAQDKLQRIVALVEHYHAGGEWEMRGSGGGKKSEVEWILEALAELKGVEVETLRAKVEHVAAGKGLAVDKYVKQLGTIPDVATKVAELKYGTQEALVDIDELG